MFVQYPRRLKAFNFYNFENSHNSFLWPEYFIDYFCENGFHVRLWPSVLCLLFHPKTVHCSAKNACTSEITFLALVPWSNVAFVPVCLPLSLKAVKLYFKIRYYDTKSICFNSWVAKMSWCSNVFGVARTGNFLMEGADLNPFRRFNQ